MAPPSLERVFHEHGHRHRAHATGHGREVARRLAHVGCAVPDLCIVCVCVLARERVCVRACVRARVRVSL